jgi:hypothetical protein
MNTLITFIRILGWMLIVIGGAAAVAYALVWLSDNWAQMKALITADDLHDVYAREKAMDALSGLAPTPSTDLCSQCTGRILPENNTGGICDECWDEAERQFYARLDEAYLEADALPVSDAEWAAVMRAVDDEALDEEDHR